MRSFVFVVFVALAGLSPAGAQALPRPKLPCPCNETGVCVCLEGECPCVACRLSKEKRDLAEEVRALKERLAKAEAALAELERTRSGSGNLKNRSLSSGPAVRTYSAPVIRSYPVYSAPASPAAYPSFPGPSASWASPALGAPAFGGVVSGGAACPT